MNKISWLDFQFILLQIQLDAFKKTDDLIAILAI